VPAFLEAALRHHAKQKGLVGEQADNFIFGTLNSIGAMKGSKETDKGREMEAKHEADVKAAKVEKPRVRKMRVKRRHDLVELK
jgi:hypothetical protein